MKFNFFRQRPNNDINDQQIASLTNDPTIPSQVTVEELKALGWQQTENTISKTGPIANFQKNSSVIAVSPNGYATYMNLGVGNTNPNYASESLVVTNPQVAFGASGSYDGFPVGSTYNGFPTGSYSGFPAGGTYGGFPTSGYSGFPTNDSYGGFPVGGYSGFPSGSYSGFPLNGTGTMISDSKLAPSQGVNINGYLAGPMTENGGKGNPTILLDPTIPTQTSVEHLESLGWKIGNKVDPETAVLVKGTAAITIPSNGQATYNYVIDGRTVHDSLVVTNPQAAFNASNAHLSENGGNGNNATIAEIKTASVAAQISGASLHTAIPSYSAPRQAQMADASDTKFSEVNLTTGGSGAPLAPISPTDSVIDYRVGENGGNGSHEATTGPVSGGASFASPTAQTNVTASVSSDIFPSNLKKNLESPTTSSPTTNFSSVPRQAQLADEKLSALEATVNDGPKPMQAHLEAARQSAQEVASGVASPLSAPTVSLAASNPGLYSEERGNAVATAPINTGAVDGVTKPVVSSFNTNDGVYRYPTAATPVTTIPTPHGALSDFTLPAATPNDTPNVGISINPAVDNVASKIPRFTNRGD